VATAGQEIDETDFIDLAEVGLVDDVPFRDDGGDVQPEPADVGERKIALQPSISCPAVIASSVEGGRAEQGPRRGVMVTARRP